MWPSHPPGGDEPTLRTAVWVRVRVRVGVRVRVNAETYDGAGIQVWEGYRLRVSVDRMCMV